MSVFTQLLYDAGDGPRRLKLSLLWQHHGHLLHRRKLLNRRRDSVRGLLREELTQERHTPQDACSHFHQQEEPEGTLKAPEQATKKENFNPPQPLRSVQVNLTCMETNQTIEQMKYSSFVFSVSQAETEIQGAVTPGVFCFGSETDDCFQITVRISPGSFVFTLQ